MPVSGRGAPRMLRKRHVRYLAGASSSSSAWSRFIVIGPKELPAVLRTLGQWMTKIRRMAAEFQGQFQEAMREAEMADLKKQFDETTSSLNSALDPTELQDRHGEADPGSAAADSRERDLDAATPPSDPAAPATRDVHAERRRSIRSRSAPRRSRPRAADVSGADARTAAAARDQGFRRRRAAPAPSPRRADAPRRRRRPAEARRHEDRGRREGDRGHQGAADGAPDRAALAADQGAGRVLPHLHRLLLLRQAASTTC